MEIQFILQIGQIGQMQFTLEVVMDPNELWWINYGHSLWSSNLTYTLN